MANYRDDEQRRQAAAASLERRRQELRAEKKSVRGRPTGRMRRRQNRQKLFVIAGGILVICLLFVIGCTGISRIADRAAREKAGAGAAETEAGEVVIGLKGSSVQLVLQGEEYVENGAFAVDTAEGAIPESDIKIKGDVNTSEPGDYTVKYEARGPSGKASAERTVRVLSSYDYGRKAGNVPVLMYHWVYTADDVPGDLNGNWILDTTLEEQLAWLCENEFYYPGWKELRAWVDDKISLPAKCAVLTFDDGTEDFLQYGVPLLEKYKVPATSFMICWKKNDAPKKIRQHASPYVDFESHTYALHTSPETPVDGHKGIMATLTMDEIKNDLAKAAKITGNNDALAYPYGDYTEEMLEAVREQEIQCAFTTEYDRVRKGMDPVRLPRVRVEGDESFQIWKESVY